MNPPNPAGLARQTALAVFIECDLHLRRNALLLCLNEFVTNLPQLTFGLFDQAIHAVAGIEQDRNLDQRLRRSRLFRRRTALHLHTRGEQGQNNDEADWNERLKPQNSAEWRAVMNTTRGHLSI